MDIFCGGKSKTGLPCPRCNMLGQKVSYATVKSLVNSLLQQQEGEYTLCKNSDCNVVYFSTDFKDIYYCEDLKVKVWYKEKKSPVPICYCHDVTDEDIIRHIAIDKCCNDLNDIKHHTGANTGRECLTENPTGK